MNQIKLTTAIEHLKCRQIENPESLQVAKEERKERIAFYQSFSPDKLLSMTEDDFYKYISRLWAMIIWGNKKFVVDKIIADNGFDNVKKQLAELLFGSSDIIKRWDNFLKKIKGMGPATIYFEIGKATLSDKEMQHLDFLAKNLIAKADQETQILVTVMGSADSNTGTLKRNQHLSEARGKYVFDILTTKYGISPNRLTIKSEVVKKDAKPALNRAVIISF
jgi:hypothetical protein